MKAYIRNQEVFIKKLLADDKQIESASIYLEKQIQYLGHERLAHLYVTLCVGLLMCMFLALALFTEIIWILVIVLILGVLEVFYLLHYYLLENTLQRWYGYANDLQIKILNIKDLP